MGGIGMTGFKILEGKFIGSNSISETLSEHYDEKISVVFMSTTIDLVDVEVEVIEDQKRFHDFISSILKDNEYCIFDVTKFKEKTYISRRESVKIRKDQMIYLVSLIEETVGKSFFFYNYLSLIDPGLVSVLKKLDMLELLVGLIEIKGAKSLASLRERLNQGAPTEEVFMESLAEKGYDKWSIKVFIMAVKKENNNN